MRRKESSFFLVESEVAVEDEVDSAAFDFDLEEEVEVEAATGSGEASSPSPATDLRFLLFFSASFASPGGRPKRVV